MWIVAKNGQTYKFCYSQNEAIAYAIKLGGVDQFTITFVAQAE